MEDGELQLAFPKEKLAEFLSVTRPSLSRELAAMVSDGLLEVEGRRIRVISPKALKEVLEADF
ncbi:hypothetical protein MASR2M78_28660 [Treponema sp.]